MKFTQALKQAPKGLAKQMNKNIMGMGKVMMGTSANIASGMKAALGKTMTPTQRKQLESFKKRTSK